MVRWLVATGALFASAPALACGGFVCEPSAPVEQAGEDIVFFLDEAGENVILELHPDHRDDD